MGSACPFYIKGIEGEDGKKRHQIYARKEKVRLCKIREQIISEKY